MAKQTINIGTGPNTKTGDPLRTAFTKINENFTELYDGADGGSVDTLTNDTQTFSLNEEGNVVLSGDTGGVNRGLVWDYGAEAGGENSTVRQDNDGLSVRAWTEVGDGVYSAPVNIVTNQSDNEKRWTFDGDGILSLPDGGTIAEGIVTDNPTVELTPANPDVASQKLVIKGGLAPEPEYHLHLTTGDLTETSIFLGTDDHNVRTTIDGEIQITTPNESNNVWRFGSTGDLELPDNGGIVFDRANTSIRVGMGFHIASGEGVSIEAIDETDPDNLVYKNWYFGSDGNLTFPDSTVQTTGIAQGQYVFLMDGTNTDTSLTDVNFNLLLAAAAVGYTGNDTHTITIPDGTPGQRLVVVNNASLCTVEIGPHAIPPVGRAEFVFTDGIYGDGWIPLYGTV